MKHLFIITIAILTGMAGFAQRIKNAQIQTVNAVHTDNPLFSHSSPLARITNIGDTLALHNFPDTATLVIYKAGGADSGYVTGTDYLNDQAFAEHFYINGSDSSLMILGVFAQFAGKINDTSSQKVCFDIWAEGPQQAITDTMAYNGFPAALLDSVQAGVTQLGFGPAADTMKLYLFSSPTPVWNSFFAGYNIIYNFNTLQAESTLFGLASTRDSVAGHDYQVVKDTFVFNNTDTLSLATDTLTDTSENVILNVRNATLGADNVWYDNLTQNNGIRNHLAIYPVVAILNPTGLNNIRNNNLSFYGNYPNPANEQTNIKFSLLSPEGVTIQVMDMNGRLMNTLVENHLSNGVHVMPLNTSNLPDGNYIYLIRTTGGDGMAGKMVVCH